MSLYDDEYPGDWDDLDRDEATQRAYAIGVAERLGEDDRDELEAIYHSMDSAYAKSMVELAYEEGRREATKAAGGGDVDPRDLWADLVEGETVVVEPEGMPTGGRDGLPEALEPTELVEKYAVDSSEPMERPEFLER